MTVTAAVGRDVDRRRRQPGALERLIDRFRPARRRRRSFRLTIAVADALDEARSRALRRNDEPDPHQALLSPDATRRGAGWRGRPNALPVAIEARQTGVRDGNVDAARRRRSGGRAGSAAPGLHPWPRASTASSRRSRASDHFLRARAHIGLERGHRKSLSNDRSCSSQPSREVRSWSEHAVAAKWLVTSERAEPGVTLGCLATGRAPPSAGSARTLRGTRQPG